MNRPSLAHRFWKFVRKVDGDGCWEWTGAIDDHGRGRFGVNGKNQTASRVAWTLAHGEVPAGLLVCHHCDNGKCVRLTHLFLGTYADNYADMVNKGRAGDRRSLGERHGMAKLTNEQVRQIKDALRQGARIVTVARDYSVTRSIIWAIKHGVTWRHL